MINKKCKRVIVDHFADREIIVEALNLKRADFFKISYKNDLDKYKNLLQALSDVTTFYQDLVYAVDEEDLTHYYFLDEYLTKVLDLVGSCDL